MKIRPYIFSLVIIPVGLQCALPPDYYIIPAGEEAWINYPTDVLSQIPEFPVTTPTTSHPPRSCMALLEHQRQKTASEEWRLKHNELQAMCSIETIEQGIQRLKKQLTKDHNNWLKAKHEYAQLKKPETK